jgi:hypothetical protein
MALNREVGYCITWGGLGEPYARQAAQEFLRAFPGESRAFLTRPLSRRDEDDFWNLTLFGPWESHEDGQEFMEPFAEAHNALDENAESVEPDPRRYDEEITL